MLSIDFHVHSSASKDSLTSPEDIITTCQRRGIDRVVITDHNTISGALIAKDIAPHLVIVGLELMTSVGEILAAYVREDIPAGLTPEESIRRLREQDAFISISHPFDFMRNGYWGEELARIAPFIDAVEVFNARCLWQGFNRMAEGFSRHYGLGRTAGSDSHSAWEIGRGRMLVPDFEGPEELRSVIHSVEIKTDPSPFWVRFFSRYAYIRKRFP